MSVLIRNAIQSAVEGVVQNAEASAEAHKRDDDYIDPADGLLHCGKCHQPRQFFVALWNEYKPIICDCRKKQIAEEEADRKRQKIEFLRSDGFDDPTMETSVFENDASPESEASVICRNYAEKFDEYYERGKGLLLSGGVGTGKTFYASCIANALIDKLHPCLVTSVSRYIRGMESEEFGGKNEKINYLNRFDLVVFDDFGIERNTQYMNELIYSIIDARIRSGKPMIVTTNINVKQMSSSTAIEQERIYDRILSVCIPILFKGESIRKTKARDEYWNDLRDLKGE